MGKISSTFEGKGRLTLALATAASISVVGAVVIPRTLGFFDATTSNPGNSFSAGTLQMTNSKNGALVLTVGSNMKPGDIACSTVIIKNSGSLPAQVQVSESGAETTLPSPNPQNVSGDLKHALHMTVYQDGTFDPSTCGDAGGTQIWTGLFDSLPNTKLTTGEWAPQDVHTYAIVVSFPNSGTPALPSAQPASLSGDNQFQGEEASATLNWYSAQSTVSVITGS